MKNLITVFLIFISTNSWSWTLGCGSNYCSSNFMGFSSSEITVNVAANSDCADAGLTANSLLDLLEKAVDKYWNKVSTSALVFKKGSSKSISFDGITSTSTAAGNADTNTVLVGCNDDVTSFSDGFTAAVGGFNCVGSWDNCKGAVIINSRNDTYVDTYSEDDLLALLAHELGHAIGLGHSSVEYALMYYSSSGITQRFLTQDDIDGITYLYPNEKELGGLAGSCGTIDINGDGPKGPIFLSLAFILMLLISKIGRKLSHLLVIPKFFMN